jgi:hypothetical protein
VRVRSFRKPEEKSKDKSRDEHKDQYEGEAAPEKYRTSTFEERYLRADGGKNAPDFMCHVKNKVGAAQLN